MKHNSSQNLRNVFAAAIVASLFGNGLATTLTFDGDPDFADNADVTGNYGSNIAGDSTEFVTTDESGETPNITLDWPSGPQFEYHSDSRWQNVESVSDPAATETHIVQTNLGSQSGHSITFTPDAGFAVVFNSVDFGYGADFGGGSGIGTATITRDSDDSVVLTVSTASLNAGDAETLDLTFTGVVGESYTLSFTDTVDTTNGGVNSNWAAIDDLSFGQTDDPGPPTSSIFSLMIEVSSPGSGQFDFSWASLEGKVYDLVSSTDLSVAASEWSIWENHEGISATPPLNVLNDVPGGSEAKRFFAVIERDAE